MSPCATSAMQRHPVRLPLSASALETPINWTAKWLAPYSALREPIAASLHSGQPVAEVLNTLKTMGSSLKSSVQFVPASTLPSGESYESFIHRTGTVPTRNNLHDLFNGIVWRRFPRAKKRLNELQAAEITTQGVRHVRGALRDALTLFDENAALLQAPVALVDSLKHRDWRALFITHRQLWADAHLTLFGHALMEKLVAPRKGITAHVWLLPPGMDVEEVLLDSLSCGSLTQKPFHPLPVLGVPGWWPGNDEPEFYEDLSVFRPPRLIAKTP